MAEQFETTEDWRQPSLAGLAALQLEAMPAFEVLFLDDLAGYLMGSGPLAPPYTVEHGARVVSALFGAILNSAAFTPEQQPAVTAELVQARTAFVAGAHDFAAKGLASGLPQLVNRLITAALGELELHKDSPEEQARSLFYYGMLAVASGPLNLLNEAAAEATMQLFWAWDQVLGAGLFLPWRNPVPN